MTRKGPLVAVTLTCIASLATAPLPARLSRTVTWKFIVRVIVGKDSPMVDVLLRMFASFGNVRDGLVTGSNDLKIGRAFPSLSLSGGDAGPRSYSSQQYVRESPFGSLAVAVKTNGVIFGIVKSGPALTVGGVLPVGV